MYFESFLILTNDGTVGDIGEPLNDQSGASHFSEPIVVGSLGPVVRVIFVSKREDRDLMTFPVQILYGGVVGVLVRNEEGTPDLTTVGVLSLAVEDFFVEVDVVDVHSTVEGDGDHLGNLAGFKASGDSSPVSRTVTVWQHTLGGVAVWGSVWIGFHR